MTMNYCSGNRRKALPCLLFLFLSLNVATLHAQNCAVNAGGNATVCGSSTTLTGGVTGTPGAGTPTWTFISGPVIPLIASPNALSTSVTGMTVDGNYIFELSRACGVGTATSRVTITAHPRPAGFTAGPDVTTICATVGTTPLAGVIPAGFTGAWRAVNIYSKVRFGTDVSTNATFSNTAVATPDFSLIEKANHPIDPAYYTILRIISTDGACSYEDTAVVRFVPNPVLVYPILWDECRLPGETEGFMDMSEGSPVLSTNQAGAAGTVAAGTTISLNVASQPAGATMTFSSIHDGGRLIFTGADIPGTYKFTLTITNSCGSHTTPEITYIFRGTTPRDLNLQPTGHGAPEQLALYSYTGSAGEIHCNSKAGTTTPETFYFSINPLDPPTIGTTVESSGILPPGGAPAVVVSGAGTYNRTATITPPAGGWQVGTYAFYVEASDGTCAAPYGYYIHISDNSRPTVTIPDVSVCYPGAGSVLSATVPLPAVYKGVVNTSYFQDLDGYYNFTVISKPAGSANPTYTSSDLRSITSSSTTISNLNRTGDYVFKISAFSGNGTGPFLEAEYGCSGTSFVDTFTIHVEDKINANAGSDQSGICTQTVSLLGNSPGTGTGLWTIVDAPAGTSPNIVAPNAASTTANGLDAVGDYQFAWTITTPLGGCFSADTVSRSIVCALPVSLTDFTVTRRSATAVLDWQTASESNNRGFGIERSTDGSSWNQIAFQPSKAVDGNSVQHLAYSYTDHSPANGVNYYRLNQVDLDGSNTYSPIRQVKFAGGNVITVYPNPAKDNITIEGISGNETITIYDVTGRKVRQTKAKASQQNIAIADLGEGIYHILITAADGSSSTYKVTKIK